MSDMYELRSLAKKLGVKLGEELPTKAGSVIRTKRGILILRVWNNWEEMDKAVKLANRLK